MVLEWILIMLDPRKKSCHRAGRGAVGVTSGSCGCSTILVAKSFFTPFCTTPDIANPENSPRKNDRNASCI
jgi:hypothetical protein